MKTGIVRIGYAPITFGTGTVTFGTPVYLADAQAGAREYSAEPKGDLHTVWANSALVYAGNANSGYDIDVTLIDIIDDIAKSWYGDVSATMGSTAGVAEEGRQLQDRILPLFCPKKQQTVQAKQRYISTLVQAKSPL